MGRKKKKQMKVKKRTIKKERKRRIPDQRSKGSKNGKEAILNQWERENGISSDQINFWQGKWLPAKENPFLVSLPFRLPFKVVLDWQYPTPPEQRGKDRNTQLLLQKTLPSRKSYWSVIVRLIFDSIRSRVQNKVMVQLWFGNRINHLPCEFYTLWVIYFQLSPRFPLRVHLKAKSWHLALHSRLQGRLPLAQVHCFSKIWCPREWFIFSLQKACLPFRWKNPVDR